MAIAISITDCRSKSGTLTLPYFAPFTGGAPAKFKRNSRCGHCLFDCPPFYNPSLDALLATPDLQHIVQTGDVTAQTRSGVTVFGGFTATWSYTLTPVDNNDGTITYTCVLSVVLSSGVVSGVRLMASGGTAPAQMVNGDTRTVSYFNTVPAAVGNGFLQILFKRNGGADNAINFPALDYARANGYQNFADPYSFLFGEWCYNPPGLNMEVMAGYNAFDIPKDCSSSFCWPPSITAGVATCPFRIVEEQATATGLTVGTTYHATFQYEWRPLAGGSWSTSTISTFTVNFVAGAATEAIPWIAPTHTIMNAFRSTSGRAVEYRLNAVTIT